MNTTTRKKYRIRSRARFTFFLVILFLIIAIGFSIITNNASSLTKQDYINVSVKPGDTLWTIAHKYMSNDMDPREAVSIICDNNDLLQKNIVPGQILKVPVR